MLLQFVLSLTVIIPTALLFSWAGRSECAVLSHLQFFPHTCRCAEPEQSVHQAVHQASLALHTSWTFPG